MSVAVEALDVERIAEPDVAGRAAAWKAALRKWPIALGAGVIVLWVLIALTVPLWSPSGPRRASGRGCSRRTPPTGSGPTPSVATCSCARCTAPASSLPTAAAVIVLTVAHRLGARCASPASVAASSRAS
ncbi:MAG: hypothetical protein WKF58_06210 [Ilumatobacteraceae bacterium]